MTSVCAEAYRGRHLRDSTDRQRDSFVLRVFSSIYLTNEQATLVCHSNTSRISVSNLRSDKKKCHAPLVKRNSHFSLESKCLKYKCKLSNGQAKKVCGPCYNKLTMSEKNSSAESASSGLPSPEENDRPLAPVDIANKLEALENPAKPPIVIYKPGGRWDKFKTGLEPADQVIVDRLKKLKDADMQGPAPSIEEIRRRLAILKDQDPDCSPQNINIHQTDQRTDKQKEDDLIREYLESLELCSGSDPAKEVEARLNSLKGFDPAKQSSGVPDSDEDDDETATKKLIEKALAEAALEAKYEAEELEPPEDMEVEAGTASSDEEPSCCICDQTGSVVKCTGCSGDLYCATCFDENHDDFEMGKHKAVPFEGSRTATPD